MLRTQPPASSVHLQTTHNVAAEQQKLIQGKAEDESWLQLQTYQTARVLQRGACPAVQEAACGCAGIYSAPVALALYAHAFEGAGALDRLEAFASLRGADFYGLPRNTSTITLHKEDWTVPAEFEFGDGVVVPMWAGQTLTWQVTAA